MLFRSYKYNKVTHKYDDLTKDEVEGKIDEIEHDFPKKNHVFKIKKYEAFTTGINIESPLSNSNLDKPMNPKRDNDCHKCDMDMSQYMVIKNLKTIHRLCKEILSFNRYKVDESLLDGHNWAEDHISVAKESLSHVYNFLVGKVNEDLKNYMFFSNLETMCKYCEEILEMDIQKIDNILLNGHDWVEDHVSSSKENIQQVCDWLNTHIKK